MVQSKGVASIPTTHIYKLWLEQEIKQERSVHFLYEGRFTDDAKKGMW